MQLGFYQQMVHTLGKRRQSEWKKSNWLAPWWNARFFCSASKNDVLHLHTYGCMRLFRVAGWACFRAYAAHISVAIFFEAAQTGFAAREDFYWNAAPFTRAARAIYCYERAHNLIPTYIRVQVQNQVIRRNFTWVQPRSNLITRRLTINGKIFWCSSNNYIEWTISTNSVEWRPCVVGFWNGGMTSSPSPCHYFKVSILVPASTRKYIYIYVKSQLRKSGPAKWHQWTLSKRCTIRFKRHHLMGGATQFVY